MCCIPALYSIMVLFCIETCGLTSLFIFPPRSSLVCFRGLWFGLLRDESATSDLGSLEGEGGEMYAASNLPAEPVGCFSWTETRRTRQEGPGEGETMTIHSQHTDTDFTRKNPTRTNPLNFRSRRQACGSPPRSNHSDTRCIHELAAVTVQDCTHCKKGFLCSRSTDTPEALHSWVFYKSVGSFFWCILAVNNCVKNAFNEYSKVRRAFGMQRVLGPIFCIQSLFFVVMCHFARWRDANV